MCLSQIIHKVRRGAGAFHHLQGFDAVGIVQIAAVAVFHHRRTQKHTVIGKMPDGADNLAFPFKQHILHAGQRSVILVKRVKHNGNARNKKKPCRYPQYEVFQSFFTGKHFILPLLIRLKVKI